MVDRSRLPVLGLAGLIAALIVTPARASITPEAAKILENTYRAVNIALVNELKMLCDRMGMDVWEVIDAAATKPFGFMPFYPGPGLGGHCIPIDPFYLTWKAREFGINTRFIELAGEINTAMPRYVVARLAEELSQDRAKALKGARILMLGLAYKKDVDDPRESPAFTILEMLQKRGAVVSYNDPHVPTLTRKSTLRDAVDKMDVYQFPALVVVDADRRPIGVLHPDLGPAANLGKIPSRQARASICDEGAPRGRLGRRPRPELRRGHGISSAANLAQLRTEGLQVRAAGRLANLLAVVEIASLEHALVQVGEDHLGGGTDEERHRHAALVAADVPDALFYAAALAVRYMSRLSTSCA